MQTALGRGFGRFTALIELLAISWLKEPALQGIAENAGQRGDEIHGIQWNGRASAAERRAV